MQFFRNTVFGVLVLCAVVYSAPQSLDLTPTQEPNLAVSGNTTEEENPAPTRVQDPSSTTPPLDRNVTPEVKQPENTEHKHEDPLPMPKNGTQTQLKQKPEAETPVSKTASSPTQGTQKGESGTPTGKPKNAAISLTQSYLLALASAVFILLSAI